MSPNPIFLETAVRIGQRLVDSAIWQDQACTWEVQVPDDSQPGLRQSLVEVAEGALYQGTAGIALFLTELYRHCPSDALRKTALGAVRHALAYGAGLPITMFGFHSGRVGVAYSAFRLGQVLGDDALLDDAKTLIEPMRGHEQADQVFDVIGGAAGSIPILLQMDVHYDDDFFLEMATALGDNLIRIAHQEPFGWSWGSPSIETSFVRRLNGLAHGAAGAGYGLLELYAVTGKPEYRYAAEQAFLYERHFYSEEMENWPDLRNTDLSDYLFYGRHAELRQLLQEGGNVPPYTLRYMNAWCHGSPGIGLSRLRAYQLLGDEIYRTEAEAAIRTTTDTLYVDSSGHAGNYSLCHGHGGNAELLLYGADMLGDDALREPAEQCALRGWELYEQPEIAWPCGTMRQTLDPSLMLGEAGIGYFYLRLAKPETPSLLLPTAPTDQTFQVSETWKVSADNNEVPYEIRRHYVSRYFYRTLHILQAFGLIDSTDELLAPAVANDMSDVEYVYMAIQGLIATQDDPLREKLLDAFELDKAHYHLSFALDDHTEEFQANWRRPPAGNVAWSTATFSLPKHSRAIHSRWHWDSWLQEEDGERDPAGASRHDTFHLLYRANNRINIRPINKFSALLFQYLQTPADLPTLVNQVSTLFAGGHDHTVLHQQITRQLQQAYQAGFIECEQPYSPEETIPVNSCACSRQPAQST